MRFRNFTVYAKSGAKIKLQTEANLTSKSNATQIVVDGDVPGYSEGVPTSSASIKGALCVEGHSSTQALFDAHSAKETLKMTFGIIDGRILSANMLIETITYDGKAADGTSVFSMELIGDGLKKVG